ncbi:MAG: DedA family protein [Burkholderiales bacterium]|nr:DedA family protein [Burkholderiales bacterium]
MRRFGPVWTRRIALGALLFAALASVMLGVRSYRTFQLLQSAYAVGLPDASTIRPWMTLRYVADAYRVPLPALRGRLGAPEDAAPDATLKSLAEDADTALLAYVQRVQRAVAEAAPPQAAPPAAASPSGLSATSEALVSALLVYGYPALALTLLLGAVGLPLPSGLSMILAGALAAQGRMSWLAASALAVLASMLGDLAGYAIGRAAGGPLLDRHGRWLGLTPARRARVDRLFDRWGALGVFLSRSLVSFLSSAVNLVAGASRYRLGKFVAFGLPGRVAWTSAYLGLGYTVSGGLEPAADFLRSLTGLLVALAAAAAAGVILVRGSAPARR